MSGFISVGYFLVSTVFSLAIFVLWARLFIRFFAIGPFHPLSQTVYQLTATVIRPIHKLLARYAFNRGRYDVDCMVLLVVCELLKFFLINVLFLKGTISIVGLVFYTLADLVIQPCNLLFYAIILRTIMSWINPLRQDALTSALFLVTEPLLKSARRLLPNTGLMDFSPIVVILALKIITILTSSLLPLPLL